MIVKNRLHSQNTGRMLASPIRVGLVSAREDHFDLKFLDLLNQDGLYDIYFSSRLEDVAGRGMDFIVIVTHWVDEVQQLLDLRDKITNEKIIAWMWDNHIDAALPFHQRIVSLVDGYFAAHSRNVQLLSSRRAQYLGLLRIPTVQWDRNTAHWLFVNQDGPRSDQLFGRYFAYDEAPDRDFLILEAAQATRSRALSCLPANDSNRAAYFGRTSADRFGEWARFKCSLALPLNRDVSSRIFDALITGQIPIVPEWTDDLDMYVPRHEQELLPILRLKTPDPDEVARLLKLAIERFDQEGFQGAYRRHLFASLRHSAASALDDLLQRSSASFDVVGGLNRPGCSAGS